MSYSCGFGLISFTYTSWTFTLIGGSVLRITGGPSPVPGQLLGALYCSDSTFSAATALAGGCTEAYSLQGRFTSDTSWVGTFSATYTGSGCFDCTNQVFPISGYTPRVTSIADEHLPLAASLEQNFPNPFNPSTTIGFSIPQSVFVTLRIYDVPGRLVATLAHEMFSAGSHSVVWEPNNLPGGVYFYRLDAGSFSQTRGLVLIK